MQRVEGSNVKDQVPVALGWSWILISGTNGEVCADIVVRSSRFWGTIKVLTWFQTKPGQVLGLCTFPNHAPDTAARFLRPNNLLMITMIFSASRWAILACHFHGIYGSCSYRIVSI